jgi:hypothetical protein
MRKKKEMTRKYECKKKWREQIEREEGGRREGERGKS